MLSCPWTSKGCPGLWSLGSWRLVFRLEMVLFPDMTVPPRIPHTPQGQISIIPISQIGKPQHKQ